MNTEDKKKQLEAAGWLLSWDYDSNSYAFQGFVTSPNGIMQIPSAWHFVSKEDSRARNYDPTREEAVNEAIEKAFPHYRDFVVLAELRAYAKNYLDSKRLHERDVLTDQIITTLIADALREETL